MPQKKIFLLMYSNMVTYHTKKSSEKEKNDQSQLLIKPRRGKWGGEFRR